LQITRSIGDVYLKKPEFNREPLYTKFRLQETFKRPLLSSDPAITVHQIQPTDKFVIFASDGLWEHLSNQEAVDLVQSSPRNVCIPVLCFSFVIQEICVCHAFFSEHLVLNLVKMQQIMICSVIEIGGMKAP
jgi:serine/threonine protein phosphatase PrpC